MSLRCLVLLLLALCAWPARAADYAPVVPGTPLAFPRDRGAHPDFRTEWWYVTGWLEAEGEGGAARQLGFQVTFFRVRPAAGAPANPSRFAPAQILFAHAALADPAAGRLVHAERIARAGFGLAQAREGDTDVAIDDWFLRAAGEGYRTRVGGRDFELELELRATQPPLLQGVEGYSRKDADPRHASYYYSRPQLAVTGTLVKGGARLRVAGSAWLDHEWSSELLADGAVGWDWVGLNLADGGALMAFRLRDAEGRALWSAARLRAADGTLRSFETSEVSFEPLRRWRSPRTGADYPVAMRVTLAGRVFELEPLMDDQELDARASTGTVYWEGAVAARGAGRELGRGYLELTGYWGRLRM